MKKGIKILVNVVALAILAAVIYVALAGYRWVMLDHDVLNTEITKLQMRMSDDCDYITDFSILNRDIIILKKTK